MLRFANPPDEAFYTILKAFLEISIDELREAIKYNMVDDVLDGYMERTRRIFTAQELLGELEKLLQAHESPVLFMPTDYHFLILYDILEQNTALHNDLLDEDGLRIYENVCIGEIDFDDILDMYFWDTDFLMNPDWVNRLSAEAADSFGFNIETFGVVNRLKPHPDELKLEVYDEKATLDYEGNYKFGECYPYYE